MPLFRTSLHSTVRIGAAYGIIAKGALPGSLTMATYFWAAPNTDEEG